MIDKTALAAELAACTVVDRDLDARVAVATYSDTDHDDDRDNTYARLPRKSDECTPGTYWVSAFSGLSLRTAPCFTGSENLRKAALVVLNERRA